MRLANLHGNRIRHAHAPTSASGSSKPQHSETGAPAEGTYLDGALFPYTNAGDLEVIIQSRCKGDSSCWIGHGRRSNIRLPERNEKQTSRDDNTLYVEHHDKRKSPLSLPDRTQDRSFFGLKSKCETESTRKIWCHICVQPGSWRGTQDSGLTEGRCHLKSHQGVLLGVQLYQYQFSGTGAPGTRTPVLVLYTRYAHSQA